MRRAATVDRIALLGRPDEAHCNGVQPVMPLVDGNGEAVLTRVVEAKLQTACDGRPVATGCRLQAADQRFAFRFRQHRQIGAADGGAAQVDASLPAATRAPPSAAGLNRLQPCRADRARPGAPDSPVRSASAIRNGLARAQISKLRKNPLLNSSTDAVSTKRSLSGRRSSSPAPTSVAVMRETVSLGIPVYSVRFRLMTGASAVAIRRRTSSPRASAVTSSPSCSLVLSRSGNVLFGVCILLFMKHRFEDCLDVMLPAKHENLADRASLADQWHQG